MVIFCSGVIRAVDVRVLRLRVSGRRLQAIVQARASRFSKATARYSDLLKAIEKLTAALDQRT